MSEPFDPNQVHYPLPASGVRWSTPPTPTPRPQMPALDYLDTPPVTAPAAPMRRRWPIWAALAATLVIVVAGLVVARAVSTHRKNAAAERALVLPDSLAGQPQNSPAVLARATAALKVDADSSFARFLAHAKVATYGSADHARWILAVAPTRTLPSASMGDIAESAEISGGAVLTLYPTGPDDPIYCANPADEPDGYEQCIWADHVTVGFVATTTTQDLVTVAKVSDQARVAADAHR